MDNKITVTIEGEKIELELTKEQIDKILNRIKNKKFIPKNKQPFYTYYKNNNGDYHIWWDYYNTYDVKHISLEQNSNIFETEKEVKEYIEYLKALDIYTFEPDWDNDNQVKWFIYYSSSDNEIHTDYYCCRCFSKTISYFNSKTEAIDFINKVGKENVKKFMFNIYE